MSAAVEHDPRPFAPPGEIDLNPARPILGPLLRYWREQRKHRQMPARADIDPVDIPELLPHIGLIDVERSPRRFHYRLVGSYMNTLFGVNYQGKYLDEAKHGEYRRFLHDLYSQAVDRRKPVLSGAVFDYGTDRVVTVRRLILPLAEAGSRPVNMLLFANVFDAPNLPSRSTPVMHLRMDAPFQAAELTTIDENVREIIEVA